MPCPPASLRTLARTAICTAISTAIAAAISATLATVCGCAMLAAPVAAQSITTTFAANNGGKAGWTVMFDFTVKQPLYVTALDVNVGEAASTPITLDVYTTPTTYVGKELTAAAWTKVTTGSGTAQGSNVPSPVAVADVFFAPGTYGFCVHHVDCSAAYTDGNGGNQMYGNPEVDLQLGASTGGFFSGLLFKPRVWNGTIHYASSGHAAYGTYGTGCTGSNGVLQLAPAIGSLPKIGQALTLEVTQGPMAAAGVVLLGFDKQKLGSVPLPIDLSALGMPGCALYLDPRVSLATTFVMRKATLSLPIPNDPTLLLLAFQNQAVAFDPGANALGLTTSNGGEAVIGS